MLETEEGLLVRAMRTLEKKGAKAPPVKSRLKAGALSDLEPKEPAGGSVDIGPRQHNEALVAVKAKRSVNLRVKSRVKAGAQNGDALGDLLKGEEPIGVIVDKDGQQHNEALVTARAKRAAKLTVKSRVKAGAQNGDALGDLFEQGKTAGSVVDRGGHQHNEALVAAKAKGAAKLRVKSRVKAGAQDGHALGDLVDNGQSTGTVVDYHGVQHNEALVTAKAKRSKTRRR